MTKQPTMGFLVADGSRGRLLLRHGDGRYTSLAALERSPAYQCHHDGRTRVFAPSGDRRSAVEGGPSQRDRDEFLGELIGAVNQAVADSKLGRLGIVAPPRILAALKRRLAGSTEPSLVAEWAKDLTKSTDAHLHSVLDSLAVRAGAVGDRS